MRNKKNIEVEIRGPLSRKDFDYFLNFLRREATFLDKGNNNVFLFQENKILNIKKDKLRITQTNNSEKVCFKQEIGKDSNEEIEFFLKKGEFLKVITFLKQFGFIKYSKASAERYDFLYNKIKVSLKDKCIIGLHYEMEILTNRKDEIAVARGKLIKLANKFGLKIWNDIEYKKHKSRMWRIHRK